MGAALPTPVECPCENEISTLVPGSAGADGEDGADGNPGANAFTNLAAAFTMPAVDGVVVVTVNEGDWIGLGQTVFVEFAGYMKCTGREGNSVTLQNLGISENAAEGAEIPNGSLVSPGGVIGNTGADGANTNLSGIGSPEGAILGSVGYRYLDIADPAYPKEYVKTSGANTNTGWVLLVAT
jgi:hypothetical protein